MVSAPQPTALPLRAWADAVGMPYSTAYRYALHGQLNGSSEDRPHAYRDNARRWWVTPQVYRVVEPAKSLPASHVDASTLAALFRQFADFLEQKGA